MGLGRNWTAQEEEYLSENWGHSSVPKLCEKLGRSHSAIMLRVQRLGLPPFLEAGEYITLNQLIIAVTGSDSGYGYKMTSWVKNRGLPVHNKRNNACMWRVVYIEEFWRWAEKNRSFIDFSKMEPLILGKEPPWVASQRKKDFTAFANQRKDPWTSEEDSRLVYLLKQHRYGYAKISKELRRSAGAIQRRCTDLKLMERPVKADNHTPWTEHDYQILTEGIRGGSSYTEIGNMIDRSEKAVRSRVFEVYRTEVADKIRTMLGSGTWGDGAPQLTVWEARRKAPVKQDLSKLVELLKIHRNSLGFDGFWQKDMCLKWDIAEGCTANCDNCDECSEFRRIPPQYCVRCGATFFERRKELRCSRCRGQRKRQAARKYYAACGRVKRR